MLFRHNFKLFCLYRVQNLMLRYEFISFFYHTLFFNKFWFIYFYKISSIQTHPKDINRCWFWTIGKPAILSNLINFKVFLKSYKWFDSHIWIISMIRKYFYLEIQFYEWSRLYQKIFLLSSSTLVTLICSSECSLSTMLYGRGRIRTTSSMRLSRHTRMRNAVSWQAHFS